MNDRIISIVSVIIYQLFNINVLSPLVLFAYALEPRIELVKLYATILVVISMSQISMIFIQKRIHDMVAEFLNVGNRILKFGYILILSVVFVTSSMLHVLAETLLKDNQIIETILLNVIFYTCVVFLGIVKQE